MFSNYGTFSFVSEDTIAIFCNSKGQWEGSTAIFPYSNASW